MTAATGRIRMTPPELQRLMEETFPQGAGIGVLEALPSILKGGSELPRGLFPIPHG